MAGIKILCLLLSIVSVTWGLDNGLALTPPMGWLTWERFRCITDCYPEFGKMLNATGRPILYSCSWPAYQEDEKILPDYASIAKHCNLWRNWDDIEDSWSSLAKIMNWFGDNQERFAKYAGPGHWNDPDMLLIGNFGLSEDQARVQMAVWAVLAAPLLISADLATMKPEFKKILLNKDIIAVNQDPLGKQGLRVWKQKNIAVWNRELCNGERALAFVSHREDGIPYPIKLTLQDMQLPEQTYEVQDLYNEEPNRILRPNEEFNVRINPSGVKFYKFIPKNNDVQTIEVKQILSENVNNNN